VAPIYERLPTAHQALTEMAAMPNSASAGTGHEKFSGAVVVSIEGKLQARGDNSVRRDAVDNFTDAIRTAEINIAEEDVDFDTEHAEQFKLAA
jgi:hypothetical protein